MRVLANHPKFGKRTFNDIKMLNAAQKFDKEWVYVEDSPILESEKEVKKVEVIAEKSVIDSPDFDVNKFTYTDFMDKKESFTIDQLILFSEDKRLSISKEAKKMLNKAGYEA